MAVLEVPPYRDFDSTRRLFLVVVRTPWRSELGGGGGRGEMRDERGGGRPRRVMRDLNSARQFLVVVRKLWSELRGGGGRREMRDERGGDRPMRPRRVVRDEAEEKGFVKFHAFCLGE